MRTCVWMAQGEVAARSGPGAFGKPESVFRGTHVEGVPRPGPSPAAFVHLRCASADWLHLSAPFPGGGPPIISTFRREDVRDAMALPCRESPTTGTVACSNSWAALGGANPPPPATSNAEQGQRHKLKRQPGREFAGALFPCGVWRDGSKPRHNQSVTWPRSESVSSASHPSADLSRSPRPRRAPGDSHGTLHPARHVSQC